VLEEACRQVAAWQAEFPADPKLTISVNLSPRQFQQSNLVDQVSGALRAAGLAPTGLKLEITEGAIMRDVEATIKTLWQLKRLGVQLAIDDFGTGYSSLASLKRLPLDILKIDHSFINGIGHDPEDTAIVRAIILLAKSLHLSVTGEGIETAEQAALLRGWACEHGQGYFFSRPMEGAALTEMLRACGHICGPAQAA
jgi:EAL domain-containing protein (putative c-di-GMP-specific phosphodiesterase class I)